MRRLKLVALDDDDLAVLSAHLQDAVMLVGQIRYLPGRRTFTIVVNRFDWDGQRERSAGNGERRMTAVQFNAVTSAQSRNIRRDRPDAVLSLLQLVFSAGETPPAGTIELVFAGGGSIALDVECVDAALEDLGPVWETGNVPAHDLE